MTKGVAKDRLAKLLRQALRVPEHVTNWELLRALEASLLAVKAAAKSRDGAR